MQARTQWYHIFTLAVATAVLVYFLYLVRDVLPPFIIALAAAWLLDPLLERLQKRGCPRILAVSAVYVAFLAVFVVGLIFLVPALIEQAKQLAQDFPAYSDRLKTLATGFMEDNRSTLLRFHLPTTLEEAFAKYGNQVSIRASSGIQFISNWIAGNLSKALWIILIPLVSFYLLNDIDRIKRRSVLFIPEQWRPRATEVLSKVGTVFSSYVRGLVVVCLLYGVVTAITLTGLKLSYSIILGLLAGILYAVPYIGAIGTVLIVFLVGLATYPHGFAQAATVALAMIILNQVFDLLITPKILGKSVGLHPVLSLFALMAGGRLFGLAGMILAVPVAASIQEVVFEFYPELRPVPEKKQKRKAVKKAKKAKQQ